MAKRKTALQKANDKVKALQADVARLTEVMVNAQSEDSVFERAAMVAIDHDNVEGLLKRIQSAVIAIGPTTPRFTQIVTLLRWAEGRMVDNRDAERKMAERIGKPAALPVYPDEIKLGGI